MGFIRNEKKYCNIPLEFADRRMTHCPFCSKERPKWLMKEEWQILGEQYGFLGRMFHFKCPECESIVKLRESDIDGYSFSKGTLEGMLKKAKGKELRESYVIIVKAGDSVPEDKKALVGKELTLTEFLNI